MRGNDQFFDLMWNANIDKLAEKVGADEIEAEQFEYVEVPQRQSNSLVLFNFCKSNSKDAARKNPAA